MCIATRICVIAYVANELGRMQSFNHCSHVAINNTEKRTEAVNFKHTNFLRFRERFTSWRLCFDR